MERTVWKSLLDAELNVRYWKYLTRRYHNREVILKIFLAIISSGTVASWSIWGEFPGIWKVLSSLSAIIAIALPILNYQKLIETTSDLSSKWYALKIEYEDYWSKLENNRNSEPIDNLYKETKTKEISLSEKETKLPHNKRLIYKCYYEVKKSYGLN